MRPWANLLLIELLDAVMPFDDLYQYGFEPSSQRVTHENLGYLFQLDRAGN